MCGIIFGATKLKKSVASFILDQYEDQHSRGMRGFGAVIENKKGSIDVFRSTEPLKFFFDVQTHGKDAQLILAHHRTPTSSENKCSQTHPIFVSNPKLSADYFIVHNGCISNDNELKKKQKALGFEYTTVRMKTEDTYEFNDSEALAIDVARYLDENGESDEITAEGSAAWIALKVDKKTHKPLTLFFARRMNPLRYNWTDDELYLASELPLDLSEACEENKLYSVDLKEEKFNLLFEDIKWKEKVYTNTYVQSPNSYYPEKTAKQGEIGFKTGKNSSYANEELHRAIMEEAEKQAGDEAISYQKRFREVQIQTDFFNRNLNETKFITPFRSSGIYTDLIEDFQYAYIPEQTDPLLEKDEEAHSEKLSEDLGDLKDTATDDIEEFFELLSDRQTAHFADSSTCIERIKKCLEGAVSLTEISSRV